VNGSRDAAQHGLGLAALSLLRPELTERHHAAGRQALGALHLQGGRQEHHRAGRQQPEPGVGRDFERAHEALHLGAHDRFEVFFLLQVDGVVESHDVYPAVEAIGHDDAVHLDVDADAHPAG